MKTSNEVHTDKARISQLRSSLYLIAYGNLSADSARREAERAMKLDDKMKPYDDDSLGR